MKKPKFNAQQEQWLAEQIEIWYEDWSRRITRDQHQPHNLAVAKEELKVQLITMDHKDNCAKDDKETDVNKDKA